MTLNYTNRNVQNLIAFALLTCILKQNQSTFEIRNKTIKKVKQMLNHIYNLYAYLFAKKIFIKFNKFLYQLSLRGLGVLNWEDEYLSGEKYWLKFYLNNKEKPVVLDVGANVGDFSKITLASNKNTCIYAFEPHPKTYKLLIENIKSYNFYPFNVGVGEKDDVLNLYDYESKDGSKHASLYKEVIEDIHKSKAISHSVQIIKLDDFLKNKNIDNIDLLKIDAEGNEFKILLGVQNYLNNNKIKAIHFEFNEMNIISKTSFKDFWDLLPNYKFFRILPGGNLLEIKNYSPITCEIYAIQNIIAILKV